MVIHGNECIILFLTRYLMSWTLILPKQLSIADFAVVAEDSLFWFSIVTSRTTVDLWRHANVGH